MRKKAKKSPGAALIRSLGQVRDDLKAGRGVRGKRTTVYQLDLGTPETDTQKRARFAKRLRVPRWGDGMTPWPLSMSECWQLAKMLEAEPRPRKAKGTGKGRLQVGKPRPAAGGKREKSK